MAELTPEIRAYLKEIARKGGRNGSRVGKSITARLTAARRWHLRKVRYGPSGSKPKAYSDWRREHGMPSLPPDPTIETTTDNRSLTQRRAELI